VHSLAISPDGETIASAGAFDHTVKLWSLATGRELGAIKDHQGSVRAVTFSSDGRTLVSGSLDNTVRLWDVATRKQVGRFDHTASVDDLALSSDGKTLAAIGNDTVLVWDIASRRQRAHVRGVKFAFADAGRTLVVGCPDGPARLYDIATQQFLAPLEEHPAFQARVPNLVGGTQAFSAVAFSSSREMFAAAGQDRSIMLWDVATRQPVGVLKGHRDWIWSMAFSPDGQTLVSCGSDSTVKLWNLKVQQEAATLKGHWGQVAAVAFAPDGNLVATAGSDGKIRLWRASPFAETDAPLINSPVAPEPPRLTAVQDEGFLRNWLILAPIPLEDGQTNGAVAVDKEQIVGEATLHPRAGERVPTGGKDLLWKEHRGHGSFVDFNALLGQDTLYSVAYAACYVVSDRERKNLQLRIGSGGQAKVYLNGKEVYAYRGVRSAAVDEDTRAGIALKQGTNVLVFKIVKEEADGAGCIRFVQPDGSPVQGLEMRLTP
jgi:WD40 repeat protein